MALQAAIDTERQAVADVLAVRTHPRSRISVDLSSLSRRFAAPRSAVVDPAVRALARALRQLARCSAPYCSWQLLKEVLEMKALATEELVKNHNIGAATYNVHLSHNIAIRSRFAWTAYLPRCAQWCASPSGNKPAAAANAMQASS